MKRFATFGFVAVLLLSTTGCGGPDALMKEFLVNLNAYAETLEKKESSEKQAGALERIKTTIEKVDKLKLSKEEQEKLLARYDAEFKRAKERIEAARKTLIMEGGSAAEVPDLFGVKK